MVGNGRVVCILADEKNALAARCLIRLNEKLNGRDDNDTTATENQVRKYQYDKAGNRTVERTLREIVSGSEIYDEVVYEYNWAGNVTRAASGATSGREKVLVTGEGLDQVAMIEVCRMRRRLRWEEGGISVGRAWDRVDRSGGSIGSGKSPA